MGTSPEGDAVRGYDRRESPARRRHFRRRRRIPAHAVEEQMFVALPQSAGLPDFALARWKRRGIPDGVRPCGPLCGMLLGAHVRIVCRRCHESCLGRGADCVRVPGEGRTSGCYGLASGSRRAGDHGGGNEHIRDVIPDRSFGMAAELIDFPPVLLHRTTLLPAVAGVKHVSRGAMAPVRGTRLRRRDFPNSVLACQELKRAIDGNIWPIRFLRVARDPAPSKRYAGAIRRLDAAGASALQQGSVCETGRRRVDWTHGAQTNGQRRNRRR